MDSLSESQRNRSQPVPFSPSNRSLNRTSHPRRRLQLPTDGRTNILTQLQMLNNPLPSKGGANTASSSTILPPEQQQQQSDQPKYTNNYQQTGGKNVQPGLPSGGALIFVIVSFIVLMLITIAWLLSYYIQRFRQLRMTTRVYRRRQQLAKRAISRIPTKILEEGDGAGADDESKTFCNYNDTSCAICIENHVVGDNVRILPCRHIFHKKCIDPWLYERQTCPICKLDILKAVGFPHKFVADATIETDPGSSPEREIPPQHYSPYTRPTSSSGVVGGISAGPPTNTIQRTTTFDVSALETPECSSFEDASPTPPPQPIASVSPEGAQLPASSLDSLRSPEMTNNHKSSSSTTSVQPHQPQKNETPPSSPRVIIASTMIDVIAESPTTVRHQLL